MIRILCLVLLTVICFTSYSQSSFGLNFKAYMPHGQFNQNINKTPLGISFIYTRKINDGRFLWGVEPGVAMYYNDRYTYELVKEGYPGEFIEVEEEDCFWTLHLLGQYELVSIPAMTTYLEIRFGVTTFFSSRTAVDEDELRFDGQFETHGAAFNAGFGGGVMLNPKVIFTEEKEGGLVWINLGFNVHSGTASNYRNIEYNPKGVY